MQQEIKFLSNWLNCYTAKPVHSGVYRVRSINRRLPVGLALYGRYDVLKDRWYALRDTVHQASTVPDASMVNYFPNEFEWCGAYKEDTCMYCGKVRDEHTFLNACLTVTNGRNAMTGNIFTLPED